MQWCKELVAALKRLSFSAQTTGGTSGRDKELCAAINQAEEALSIRATNRALIAVEQEPLCENCDEPVHLDEPCSRSKADGLDGFDIDETQAQSEQPAARQSEPVAVIRRPYDNGGFNVEWLKAKMPDGTQLYDHTIPAAPAVPVDRETMKKFINRELPRTHKGFRCQYQQDHIMRAVDIIYDAALTAALSEKK